LRRLLLGRCADAHDNQSCRYPQQEHDHLACRCNSPEVNAMLLCTHEDVRFGADLVPFASGAELTDLAFDQVALQGTQVGDEELAIKVVDLVLEGPGE
jgi:hypothetical protein